MSLDHFVCKVANFENADDQSRFNMLQRIGVPEMRAAQTVKAESEGNMSQSTHCVLVQRASVAERTNQCVKVEEEPPICSVFQCFQWLLSGRLRYV